MPATPAALPSLNALAVALADLVSEAGRRGSGAGTGSGEAVSTAPAARAASPAAIAAAAERVQQMLLAGERPDGQPPTSPQAERRPDAMMQPTTARSPALAAAVPRFDGALAADNADSPTHFLLFDEQVRSRRRPARGPKSRDRAGRGPRDESRPPAGESELQEQDDGVRSEPRDPAVSGEKPDSHTDDGRREAD